MRGNKSNKSRLEKIKILSKQILDASFELTILTGEVSVPPERILNVIKEIFTDVDINIVLSKFVGEKQKKGRTTGVDDKTAIVRHAARYLIAEYSNISLIDISLLTGSFNHSTTFRSIKEAQNLLDTDDDFRKKINSCKTLIRQYYYESKHK